ncbi:MAG: hypothetical protein PHT48_09725 [Dechloromonas sp.]|nr:hypothetical protein [Dechloromonas sp.]
MRFIVFGLLRGIRSDETPLQAATVSVLGLAHGVGGKGDGECADQQAGRVLFLEIRVLKNPVTGKPCVLTAG